MAQRLPLDDGGAFYHDRRPAGFHPALRGAAQLLLAGERRVPGLRESLRRGCAGAAPVDLALLGAPGVWFDAGRGFRIVRGVHSRAGRRRLRARLRPADRVAAWARRRHLGGVWVVELLLLTVAAWQELETRRRPRPGPAAGGWGPWVEVLSRPPAQADASALLELGHLGALPYLRRPRRPAPGGPLRLELPGWRLETETWEEAEGRLREGFEEALRGYRRRAERRALDAGFTPSPTRTASHHFDWMALRQLAGWGPAQLARRFGVARSTVHHALQRVSRLLELPLRRIGPGLSSG